jgi:lysophospholipase L1-like esterase
MGTRRRRLALAAVGLPLVAAAVIGVEVELARRGSNLDDVELIYEEGSGGDVRTAVWIGDSTAYGVGVSDGRSGVASRVARERNERVVMLAVSGATLDQVLDEQVGLVDRESPDVVYVSLGANDVTHFTRRDRFESAYRRLLRALPAGIPVVVLGVPDMGAPPRLAQPLRAIAGFRGRQLDRVVKRVVAEHPGASYVDIAGPTGPPFRAQPQRYFAADRYHPGAEGYRLWADAVLAAGSP